MTQVFLDAIPVFLLIFCRVTAFFVITPLFSYRSVPTTFKIGLGFFISLIVFTVQGDIQPVLVVDLAYMLLVIKEVLIGIMLGYIVYLFFTTMYTVGGMIDLQMGFAMANIIDPQTGVNASLTANFKYLLILVTFVNMDAHHLLLRGLMDSFKYLPLDNEWYTRMLDGSLAQFLIEAFAYAMLLGVQIATPLIVVLFLADLGLGFLAKTAPQFNVFVIGFAIKILVGLIILFIILPKMGSIFEFLFNEMFKYMEGFFSIFFNAS